MNCQLVELFKMTAPNYGPNFYPQFNIFYSSEGEKISLDDRKKKSDKK